MKTLFYIAAAAALVGVWFYLREPEIGAGNPPATAKVPVSAPGAALMSAAPAEAVSKPAGIDLPEELADEPRPPFPVKVYVRRIFEGWQRLEFAEGHVQQRGLRRELRKEVEAIKTYLYSDGLFTEGALRSQMLRAADELGFKAEEARFVVNRVLSLAREDKELREQERKSSSAGHGVPLPGF